MRFLTILLAFSLVISIVLLAGCLQPEQPPAGNVSPPTPPSPPTPKPPSCVDSDGGNEAMVKGTVTFGTAVHEDSCESDSVVRENYCKNSSPASELVTCPPDTACTDGACVPTNAAETPVLCNDSDGGKEYGVAGSVSHGGSTYSDACQGTYDLLEYYCEGDIQLHTTYHCPSGQKCDGGACVALEGSCSDSDQAEPLIIGTTTQYAGGMVVSSKKDYCIDNQTRNEYYCEGNTMVNSSMECPDGTYCANGACLPTCNDLDGENYSKASYVVDAAGTHYDYCLDDNRLVEYFCSQGTTAYRATTCGAVCHKGRCYSSSELTCRESGGDVTLKAGSDVVRSYNDTCQDYQTAIDYKCISNRAEYVYDECDDDAYCYEGECNTVHWAGCQDLDAMEDDDGIYVASVTIITTNDSIEEVKSDSCFTNGIVAEFSCDGSDIRVDYKTCTGEYKCVDGACAYPYTCTDSDGGQSLEPGSVSLMEGGTAVRTERDACSDDTHVHEVYCTEDDHIGYAILACPEGKTCDSTNGSCK